jgi:hypothetical protein
MSNLTAEQLAKLLFPKGLPGMDRIDHAEAMLTPEQQKQIEEEMKRMEAKLNIRNDQINESDTKPAFWDVANSVPSPIPGVNAPFGYPPSEVPDEATKAFLHELNKEPQPERQSAHGFLEEASSAMKQRAALRDAEDGERTAAQIAKVFNAITGHELSEADAWTFLMCLKIVRCRAGKYDRDSYVDLAAYAALLGESESVNRKRQ